MSIDIDLLCNICGDDLSKHFIHTTDCNHTFHYECLQKSFIKSFDKNMCPLCRNPIDKLPIVNGLKKLIIGIHFSNYEEKKTINHINTTCQYIFKSGKNKDQICNKNCKIGFNVCGSHFKSS